MLAIKGVVAPHVYVYSGREALAGIRRALDAVTAVITLLNTFMLSVLDRRSEIGVPRAIGATRRRTLNVIVAEAVGVGVVGGLLGLLVGAATQYLNTAALTNVLSIDVSYRPNPAMIPIGLGALVICLLGSVPPAIRAADSTSSTLSMPNSSVAERFSP